MVRQPGVHPYIEDNDLVMIPISEEFITVFRKKSTGKWFSKRYNGLIEPLCDNSDLIGYRKIIKVDDIFGDDAVAALDQYNIAKSFKTPEAAQAVAVSGDLIVVDPGTYNLSSPLGKNGVDWFMHLNSSFISSGSIFVANNISFNVGGYGNLVGSGFAVAVILMANDSNCVMQFNSITHSNSFYNAAQAELGSQLILKVHEKVDCSFNLSDAFYAAGNSKIIVNCPEVVFSRICAVTIDGSEIILNIDKLIASNFAGDFTGYATGYLVTIGDGNSIILNGNMYNAKTIFPDPPNGFSAAINNFGTNSYVCYNGSASSVQGHRIVRCTQPDSQVDLNGDVTSNEGDGILVLDSKQINIAGRIKVPNTPVLCDAGPGGKTILRNGILVSDNLLPSIDGTACTGVFEYNNYYGVANTAPVAATEMVGIPLVVDTDVE